MRLLEACCLTLILPTVAYVQPIDSQHGMLRNDLHSNISDDESNLKALNTARIAIGLDGVVEGKEAAFRKTSDDLKRDQLAVEKLLRGQAKVDSGSGAAPGNITCSCTGEELAKMTCSCKPVLNVAKNGSAESKNLPSESKNETSKPEKPLAPFEKAISALSPLAAVVGKSDPGVSPAGISPIDKSVPAVTPLVIAPTEKSATAVTPLVQPISFLSLRSLFSIVPAPPPSSSLVQNEEPSIRARRRYEERRSLLWDALSSGMTIPSHHDMAASRTLSLIEFVNHTQSHRLMGFTIPIAVIGTLFLVVALNLGPRDDRFAKA